MLPESKLKSFLDLVQSSTKEELIWINGYLNGLVANSNTEVPATTAKRISLVYGTETGNAKKLAAQLATVAKKKGVNAKLTGLDQYRLTDLAKEEYLFVVISTQGEGEPPLPAKKFYEYIHANQLQLPDLKYSVLALGDTSYPLYCKTGEDVDQQLNRFGAKRVVPLQKCDVDYEGDAMQWFEKVLALLEKQTTPSASTPVTKKKTEKKQRERERKMTRMVS